MTDTYDAPKPRRPLVPGPGDNQAKGPSIAAQAIALREAQQPGQLAGSGGLQGVNTAMGRSLGSEVFSRQPSPTGKVARAIANVMKEVGTIQMTGYNSFHRYKYPKMEDILPVVTPLMGEHGLVIHQNELSINNIEGNRIAVAYEFTVYHESGESLPPARHTGMAIARDSKGNWDDKCVAKCHTNARKFHMQALFEIPLEVPDNEDANQRQERRPVPGPKGANVSEALAAGATVTVTGQGGSGGSGGGPMDGTPRKLVLGQGAGADQWAGAYIKAIGQAKTPEEVKRWDTLNDGTLQSLNDRYPEVYEQIAAAVNKRLEELGTDVTSPEVLTMPEDTQEAMNWIAEQLASFKTLESARTFWKDYVITRQEEFDSSDWSMLADEMMRTEKRLTA